MSPCARILTPCFPFPFPFRSFPLSFRCYHSNSRRSTYLFPSSLSILLDNILLSPSFTDPTFINDSLVHLGNAIRMWTLRLFPIFQKESSGSSSFVKSSTSTEQETPAHCETHSVGSAAKTMLGGHSTFLDTSLHSAMPSPTTYGLDYDGIRHRSKRGDPESKVAWTGKQLIMRISHDSVSLWPEPM